MGSWVGLGSVFCGGAIFDSVVAFAGGGVVVARLLAGLVVAFDSAAFLEVSTTDACSAAAEREIAAAARLVAKVGAGAGFSGVVGAGVDELAGAEVDGLMGAEIGAAGAVGATEAAGVTGGVPGREGSFIAGSSANGPGLETGGMAEAARDGPRRKGGAETEAAGAAGDAGGVEASGVLALAGGVGVEAAGVVLAGGGGVDVAGLAGAAARDAPDLLGTVVAGG